MKKGLIFIIFMFLFPKIVNASQECSLYLKSLDISDYKYSPSFNKYTNTYTVDIPSEINELDIMYERESVLSKVNIKDNINLEHLSEIKIEVTCDSMINKYKIIINKNKDQATINYVDKNTTNKFTKSDKIITISFLTIGFLLILILIKIILFKKKKA